MKKNDKCIFCGNTPIMVLIMSFYTRNRKPRLAAHADSIAFCNGCLWLWAHNELHPLQHRAIAAITNLTNDEMLRELRDTRLKP